MKILDIDSPLILFLGKMADMMWLTILTMICCIPIITVGPSLTALHYVALKMVRNEDGYITRSFFKAFKENFRQATIIWLIFLVIFVFLFVDYRIIMTAGTEINLIVQLLLLVIAIFAVFTFMYVWPLLAKFDNTIKRTIINAFAISGFQFFKSLLMLFINLMPFLLWYFVQPQIPNIFPVLFVFWFSAPAYFSAKIYDKFFRTMEEKILEQQEAVQEDETVEEDVRIFKDEAEETLDFGQNDQ